MTDGWTPRAGLLHPWAFGAGPRVVLVHGFTQTGQSMRPLAARLSQPGRECVVVDLPGHGDAGDVYADLPRTAAMLAQSTGKAVYVGYSLGGRACLHLALRHPEVVERLVLIGANPGIEDPVERAARREADEQVAQRILHVGVQVFVQEWLSQPLFAGLTLTARDRADRLRNSPEGLATSLRLAGTGAHDPLWPRLGKIAVPTLVLAGEFDDKFTRIGQRVAAAVQRGSFAAIPGATHAAHLQRPNAVAATIDHWLSTEPA